MKRANFFQITNNSPQSVLFTPKDKKFEDYGFVTCPGDVSIKDWRHQVTDLDQWYFQFLGERKKVNVSEAHKYNVFLDYRLDERKSS